MLRLLVSLICAIALWPTSAAATSEGWQVLIGGDDANTPRTPSGIAIDGAGNVYVADTGNHRVQKLAPDGQPVSEWGGVHFPHGIAVDSDDNVYVTDEAGVRKFSAGGDLLASWTAPGQFGDPYGVAVDDADIAYVADTDTGRILALASSTGQPRETWGSEGKAIGQFKYPEALAVDGQGALYVADRGNDRVQMLLRGR